MSLSNKFLVIETTNHCDVFVYADGYSLFDIWMFVNEGGEDNVLQVLHYSEHFEFNEGEVVSIGIFEEGYIKVEKPEHYHYEVTNGSDEHSLNG